MSLPGPEGFQRLGVIIAAAGQSRRMSGQDKLFAPILTRPLLAWTVEVFEQAAVVDEIVIAVDRHKLQQGRDLADREGWRKVTYICRGGQRRQDSVREALWRLSKCDWVVVHDGARPCIQEGLLLQGLEAAQETGAAVPGLPVSDTLKRVDAQGLVRETVDRTDLWMVQTPQVFRYDILWAAYQEGNSDATDDAALVERLGYAVRVFPGSPENIKVTVPRDLLTVTSFLQRDSRGESRESLGALQ